MHPPMTGLNAGRRCVLIQHADSARSAHASCDVFIHLYVCWLWLVAMRGLRTSGFSQEGSLMMSLAHGSVMHQPGLCQRWTGREPLVPTCLQQQASWRRGSGGLQVVCSMPSHAPPCSSSNSSVRGARIASGTHRCHSRTRSACTHALLFPAASYSPQAGQLIGGSRTTKVSLYTLFTMWHAVTFRPWP